MYVSPEGAATLFGNKINEIAVLIIEADKFFC